nr:reverse transcriptase domain-containing protein [Tanacetum cinerariifolium]
ANGVCLSWGKMVEVRGVAGEWCEGGGVEGKTGESGVKGMARKPVRSATVQVFKRGGTTKVIDKKEKELWVELKRLYEPDSRDPLWALQRYMHDPLVWRLYDTCGVHHVSTERGHEIFMLVEKDYSLTKGLTTLMLVADALAEYKANKSSRNGDDSHDSGSGRRTERATRGCTYSDFLKCQPLNFKVKNVGHDDAYGMPWKILMKMMTAKYYLRSEIKKLEIKIWNLKVKGTDVVSYTQRFQELPLMCRRMFLEESDVVEKYVGGLFGMIQGSVMASKPKIMQDAIEFANELMDQKIRTFAKR